ncbi:MAG TPA: hypothetical protein VFU13_00555 [Steroidobacteraceae bacterium]|nr:hypothetical protein [Steroidobacteraceae bacterium]
MIFASRPWTKSICAALLAVAFTSAAVAQVVNPPRRSNATIDTLRYWNQVAIDASGVDHIPGVPGGRQGAEQLGPGRSARAMAIVHIAMFDAVNAITGNTFRSYTGLARETRPASVDAAIATAARDTLAQLFREQAGQFNILYNAEIARIPPSQEQQKNLGIAIGNRAATRILGMRTNDGSQIPEPRVGIDWITSNLPGRWRQDPISQIPLALGAHWDNVRPFAMTSASQFRLPPPPALNSAAYTTAFNEVKRLGGDGINTPTQRSQDQTNIGIYWAYDGVPTLCAPPRLYNQIATEISKNTTSVIDLARLYALVNVAMADAGIASWESKFFYDFWRPIGGIREADPGTGPTGAGDGNPATIGDTAFFPLGAPASNLPGRPDFTPPFPAYPSGHATFGAALFQTLRNFYGRDNIAFTFTSDELNGQTVDNNGQVRPLLPRSFNSLSQAEEENGQSRIYLGIHWAFDKTGGITQGRQVANHVFANRFQRVN